MAAKNGGPNLVRRIIDVGVAGAFTPIYATGPTRGWRIWESVLTAEAAANTPQGFQVQIPNDGTSAGFTTIFGRSAASVTNEPGDFPSFENWNRIAEHGPVGEVFAGPGNATPGLGIGATTPTHLANVCSLTATATSIEIVEYF